MSSRLAPASTARSAIASESPPRRGTLREWLIEAAHRAPGIRDKLLFSAKAGAGSDISSLKSVVRQATRVTGFVDWRGVGDYANRLGDLAQILDERIGDGNSKLVELIEDAIAQAEDSLGQIDDSNGEVMPLIMQLRGVHERACNHLGPDPAALAERLFRFQTTGDWDTFHSVLPGYETALGQLGLARYRQLVEAAWKRLPALGPKAFRTHFDSNRYRIEHAMDELTALSGDIDGLVTVKAPNLSSPHTFLEVAKLLQRHGRHDDAIKWDENGIAAFPGERLDDLMKFCITEHLRRGDADRVESDVRLWDKVAAVRGMTHPEEGVMLYKKLLPHVVDAGTRGAQYGAAFEIVKAIRELRAAQSKDAMFKQELVELRLEWKAKRNFMKLLATLG